MLSLSVYAADQLEGLAAHELGPDLGRKRAEVDLCRLGRRPAHGGEEALDGPEVGAAAVGGVGEGVGREKAHEAVAGGEKTADLGGHALDRAVTRPGSEVIGDLAEPAAPRAAAGDLEVAVAPGAAGKTGHGVQVDGSPAAGAHAAAVAAVGDAVRLPPVLPVEQPQQQIDQRRLTFADDDRVKAGRQHAFGIACRVRPAGDKEARRAGEPLPQVRHEGGRGLGLGAAQRDRDDDETVGRGEPGQLLVGRSLRVQVDQRQRGQAGVALHRRDQRHEAVLVLPRVVEGQAELRRFHSGA